MSAVKQIAATVRSGVGKGAARAVRRAGHVPAVIYGAGKAPTPIALDANKTNLLVYAGHFLTTIFEIEVDGEKTRAIPRDYQLDPVTDRVVHVDFLRLAAGARVRLMIPVHVTGTETSPGVKRGGAVNIVSHSLELMVPADDIPEAVVVDISGLDINGSVHISQVTLPAGTKRVHSDDETLVSIVPPTIVADAAPAAAAAEAPAKK
ncbi:MAG: 50S ribosomal protein L25/general stress protein Ctc [Labrys sp. (in: a-proteobacteria)]